MYSVSIILSPVYNPKLLSWPPQNTPGVALCKSQLWMWCNWVFSWTKQSRGSEAPPSYSTLPMCSSTLTLLNSSHCKVKDWTGWKTKLINKKEESQLTAQLLQEVSPKALSWAPHEQMKQASLGNCLAAWDSTWFGLCTQPFPSRHRDPCTDVRFWTLYLATYSPGSALSCKYACFNQWK